MATRKQSGGYNPDLLPNTCQTPNVVLDKWMFSLTGAEFKVVMYAVRRSYGFGRKSSRISKSEFENGTKDKDGNYLDHGTGLSRTKVKDAIKSLVDKGILKEGTGWAASGANATNKYSLNLNYLPEVPREQTSEERSEGGQKVTPQGPESDRGEGSESDPPRGQKVTPPYTHGNPVGNPEDLPAVDPSAHARHARESSSSEDEAGPTDRLTDRPTDEGPSEKTSSSSTTAQLLEPEGSHCDEEQAPDLSPKEDEDNVPLEPEESLRREAEAIPTSGISEEAQDVAGGLLNVLPKLEKTDAYRMMRLAEHYHRKERISVLEEAAQKVAERAEREKINHPWSYLTKTCAEKESYYSEEDEALLSALSGKKASSSSVQSESPGYEWFYSSQEQQSNAGEDEQRQHTPEPDPEALEVWEKILEDVSGEINAPSLRVWFEGTVPVSLTADTLTISVPNSFAREYIENRFLELLEGALAKLLSPTSSLEIVVGAEEATHNTAKRGTSDQEQGDG